MSVSAVADAELGLSKCMPVDNGTVSWKTIMDDTASQMGVAVTYSYNATFADISNGFSYVGRAKDIMDKGCKCCGLTWSLQNGAMQVKNEGWLSHALQRPILV